MAKKKKKQTEEPFMIDAVIHGVFDCVEKKLVKVSLDEDDIEMDLTLQYSENKYSKCEFTISLIL